MNAFFVIYHKVVEHIGLEPITFRLPVCHLCYRYILLIMRSVVVLLIFCETVAKECFC